MHHEAKRRLAALAVVVCLVALSGCGLSLQSLPKPGGLQGETYEVTAVFDDVLNLPQNAQVRSGARVVGEVSSASISGYQARVVIKIRKDVELPVGTGAQVRFDNPLGDQFIELEVPVKPGPGMIRPGDQLDPAVTTAAPTVEDTLGAFATVLTGGAVGDIQSITKELNQAFSGNQPQIRELLTRLNTSAEALAGGLGPIDKALTQVARLSKLLNDDSGTLATGIEKIGPAVKVLADQNAQFNTLLVGLNALGKQGNKVIASSGKQTVTALKALVPVMDQIVATGDRISPVLANLRALVAQIPKITGHGYARVSMAAQVDFSSKPSTASGTTSRMVSSLMTAVGPLERNGATP